MNRAEPHPDPPPRGLTEEQARQLSDEELIRQYRQGHEEVFRFLIRRYRRELYNMLVRFVRDRNAAEDIFQETFLQVHQSADTFDTSRRFKPWLFTIAANKARDYLRKRTRRPSARLDAPVSGEAGEGQTFIDLMEGDLPLPEQTLAEGEVAQRVRDTVDQLPEHLQEILLLAYFQKLPYKEIAETLHIPLGTVKSRLHTAVGTFAKIWKRQNPDLEAS